MTIRSFRVFLNSLAGCTALLFACSSCNDHETDPSQNAPIDSNYHVWKKKDGPFVIKNDTLIDNNIEIEAGSTLLINDSATLTFTGDVHFAGTKEQPIHVAPIANHCGYILFDQDSANITITSTEFANSKLKLNRIAFVELHSLHFTNSAKLHSNESLICAYRGGNLRAKDITMISNNYGEGIVVTKMDTVLISNSYFENINDAVEIELCAYGEIRACEFLRNASDDAIDLNGCDSVLIIDNRFTGIADNAIETGWNLYYKQKTREVSVTNNLFEDCMIGIQAKEGAHITGIQNTFRKCQYTSCSIHEGSHQIHQKSIVDGVLNKTDSIDRDAVPTQWTYSITNGKELFGIKNCVLEDVYNIDSTTCFGQTNIGFNLVNSTSTAHE